MIFKGLMPSRELRVRHELENLSFKKEHDLKTT